MHMGHFWGHLNNSIARSFRPRKMMPLFKSNQRFRQFIETGIACWILSFPQESFDPCCDLSVLGCDGTHIGVPVKKAGALREVWKPEIPRASIVPPPWGRKQRAFLAEMDLDGNSELYEFLRNFTSASFNASQYGVERVCSFIEQLPMELRAECLMLVNMDKGDPRYSPLRKILRHVASKDSATGCILLHQLGALRSVCSAIYAQLNGESDSDSVCHWDEVVEALAVHKMALVSEGIGYLFVAYLHETLQKCGRVCESTLLFFNWLCELISKHIFCSQE